MREDGQFNKEEYLKRANAIIEREMNKINIPAIIFGSLLITIPTFMIFEGVTSINKRSSSLSTNTIRHICTDKYGYDKFGNILNSCGLPKNPQTADDLPDHDIAFDMIKPSPIDQHGTCGIAAP